jgi:hypothetical protein
MSRPSSISRRAAFEQIRGHVFRGKVFLSFPQGVARPFRHTV